MNEGLETLSGQFTQETGIRIDDPSLTYQYANAAEEELAAGGLETISEDQIRNLLDDTVHSINRNISVGERTVLIGFAFFLFFILMVASTSISEASAQDDDSPDLLDRLEGTAYDMGQAASLMTRLNEHGQIVVEQAASRAEELFLQYVNIPGFSDIFIDEVCYQRPYLIEFAQKLEADGVDDPETMARLLLQKVGEIEGEDACYEMVDEMIYGPKGDEGDIAQQEEEDQGQYDMVKIGNGDVRIRTGSSTNASISGEVPANSIVLGKLEPGAAAGSTWMNIRIIITPEGEKTEYNDGEGFVAVVYSGNTLASTFDPASADASATPAAQMAELEELGIVAPEGTIVPSATEEPGSTVGTDQGVDVTPEAAPPAPTATEETDAAGTPVANRELPGQQQEEDEDEDEGAGVLYARESLIIPNGVDIDLTVIRVEPVTAFDNRDILDAMRTINKDYTALAVIVCEDPEHPGQEIRLIGALQFNENQSFLWGYGVMSGGELLVKGAIDGLVNGNGGFTQGAEITVSFGHNTATGSSATLVNQFNPILSEADRQALLDGDLSPLSNVPVIFPQQVN